MARCKVQKAILHCLSASVYNTRNPRPSAASGCGVDALHAQTITESIIHFNEEILDSHVVEAFQVGHAGNEVRIRGRQTLSMKIDQI